tara:strand:- start:4814 stop:5962 length:1149 start_codon:yes stop_codon:yes gene_type:complete
MKKKIVFFTGSRADFGIMSKLIKLVQKKKSNTKLIVSGNHFSKNYGYTFNEIRKEKIKNIVKASANNDKTEDISILKSFSEIILKTGKQLKILRPSLFVVLGDRYEALAGTIAAMLQRIPIAHINGGELTEGAYDDFIRHSISKMSHIHFTSHKTYKKRLIQLGENKKNIFNYGSLGASLTKDYKLLNKSEILTELKIKNFDKYFVITFHPITLEKKKSKKYFQNLLDCLTEYKNINFIFTFPNADNESNEIINTLKKFKKKNNKIAIFKSLGVKKYFSLIKYSSGLIGNSSSGILEAPTFKIPILNIGDRQKGRLCARSVLNSNYTKKNIKSNLNKILSKSFHKNIKKTKNPFYKKNTVINITNKLLSVDSIKLKKKFFDI